MMANEEIIRKTEVFVRETLAGDGTGHDWWHIYRVRNMALKIAEEEGADLFITELGALLHDIADHKFHDGDENIGPETARKWLEELSVKNTVITQICEIIRDVSFKGSEVETSMKTIEGKAVQDADRLDAIGATGIARAFAYGGYKKREFYNPEIKPVKHDSFDAYKKSNGTTLNHFYEKLFLLKDRMNTKTGRRIAGERHIFMQDYVKRFLNEWEGDQ